MLNRAHLFAQEEIPLRFGNIRGDVVLDFGTQRQHFPLTTEQRQQLVQPFAHGNRLQQLLAFLQRQVQVRRDEIREMPRMIRVEGGRLDLLRKRAGQLDDFAKLLVRIPQQRLQFNGILRLIPQQLITRTQVRGGQEKVFRTDTPQPFHQHADGAVGKLYHLRQARHTAHGMQVIRVRLSHLGIDLQHGSQQAVAGHQIIHQFQARAGFDEEGDHRARENDHIGQPQNGQGVRE